MEEQIINNLGALLSQPSQNARAMECLDMLKASDTGWRLCANALVNELVAGAQPKFFCLQVVEHFLKKAYPSQVVTHQQTIHEFLFRLYDLVKRDGEPSYIRNKLAQLFSLAFVTDYPLRWPQFFDDLMRKVPQQEIGSVDMYLRVLTAIDTEVVDREVAHSADEQSRNTSIKDTMREKCVLQLVESWYYIMTTYETSHPEVVCLCLDVTGLYISWIDIQLIVNEKVIGLLLRFLKMPLLRESACDCMYEIIQKGMLPPAKTKLIQSLSTVLEAEGVMYPTEDEEGDFVAKLSKLVNGIGQQLTSAWDKLIRGAQSQEASVTLAALNGKVPLMLRFLGDNDDDVSATMMPFVNDYLGILKRLSPLSDEQNECIIKIFWVILRKLRFDDEYDFDAGDEEEAMFQDYRRQLKVTFNALTSLNVELMLKTVLDVLVSVTQNWPQRDWKEVEVGLTLLYFLAEAVPAQSLQFNAEGRVPPLQEMMRIMVSSDVISHPHQAVKMQYFETVVRYEKFFLAEPEHIKPVLAAFLDNRGLKCPSKPVRSRASYLLARFIRTVKGQLAPYTEFILKALEELLVVGTPDNGPVQWLTSDEQKFLYEVAGSLIVSSEFDASRKLYLMELLLSPVVTQFDNLYVKLCRESDADAQDRLAKCLNCAMSFASQASRGFTNTVTVASCGCTEVFVKLMAVFVKVLSAPVQRSALWVGMRQYFHRMIVCLDQAEILSMTSDAMCHILTNRATPITDKELTDFMPIVNQLITKFRGQLAGWLKGCFQLLVGAMFVNMSGGVDEQDSEALAERQQLRRTFFSFLSVICANELAIVVQEQHPDDVQRIMFAIVTGAVDFADPPAQKTCFATLRKMVELWGGQAGFNDFIIKHIVPACFVAPSKSTFDLADGQTMTVLGEIAGCLKLIHERHAPAMTSFLTNEYFPQLNLSADVCQTMIAALKGDTKELKRYLKEFYLKARNL